VGNVLDLQAALHARWWNRACPGDEAFDRGETIRGGGEFLVSPANWEHHLARERRQAIQAMLPAEMRGRDAAGKAFRAMLEGWSKSARCILHGDFHPGNLYYPPHGPPGVLDWQLWIGPWAHDFAYSVVGLLEPNDRRKHERDLLARYLQGLSAHGVDAPRFDEAWNAYRRHVIWGFLWIACPESMQDEDVVLTQAERFARAAVDLDTFGALLREPSPE
jgi:aminoglycoside phosphotransferase (APT) family kinase protein